MFRISTPIISAALLILPLLVGCQRSPSVPPPNDSPLSADAPVVIEVKMKNMEFSPATVEIKKGDVVEWKNEDITPHTATASSFDSGSIETGESWRKTFTEAGNVSYACTFHPTMKGAVIVKP